MSKIKNWIILGLGILVVILFFNFLRGSGFTTVLATANWNLIAIGFLLNIIIIGLWTLRWDIVLLRMGYRFNFVWLFLITLIANFGDMISPGARVGGEPLRVYFMQKKRPNVKLEHIATSLVLERVYNTSIFFAISSISIIYVLFKYTFSLKLHAPLIFILALTAFLTFLMFFSLFRSKKGIKLFEKLTKYTIKKIAHTKIWKKIKKKYGSRATIIKFINKNIKLFFNDLDKFVREKQLWTEGGIISIFYWIAIFAQAYFFFWAVGAKISFATVVVILAISNLSGLFSFLPSGMGLTEMIQTGLCLLFAIPLANATAAVLLIRGNFYFVGLIIGYITLTIMTKGKVRNVVTKTIK